MAFGMRNALATFQCLMYLVLGDVPSFNVYLNELVVYCSNWENHISILRTVFQQLVDAPLTPNLAKCDFAKASVTYLGKQVQHGQVCPVNAKVEAVFSFPVLASSVTFGIFWETFLSWLPH